MLTYMWQLDNYLAALMMAGFVLYFIVVVIGIIVDQCIDYFFAVKKYITTKLKGKKSNV